MIRKVALFVLICAFVASATYARSRRRQQGPSGQPGVFDYYVFSLSWSPEHCAERADYSAQCSGNRPYGFVAHGLWPQYERGYPHDCDGPELRAGEIPKDLLEIVPSVPLIEHEWPKHGTCSGLSKQQYFQKIEQAWALIKIPADYKSPIKTVEVAPGDVKRKFAQNNPGFGDSSLAVVCSGGRYLAEVRACLTKDLKPRPCGTDVHDTCRADRIIMRPVR